MAIYIIVLDHPSADAWANIESIWPKPDHHIHDSRIAVIQDSDMRLTADIAGEIGIGTELTGFVVQMDYYSGHTSGQFVEWLRKAQQ